MKKRTVHLYTHTHWDQEWYFTSSRSRIYLYNHIKNLIQVLETHPEFPCYLLDAQSSLIESYLQWAPEDRARLTKLIAYERLLTGPWFTQTDQLVIHQESVVRNLFYGMEVAQRHGNVMMLGYVPDCFGQGGNMPQLYRQFGIHHALFWRGIADNTLHETEFFWQGDNGDRVFALQMPWGYHYGGLLDETPETMKAFLDEKMAAIEARSHRQHLLFPHGFDQAPVRRNLPELVEQFNARDDSREYLISNPLTVVKMLEQEAGAEVRTLKGELTEAKHSRVHKTIFSCRADLKLLNNEVESLLVNTLEPVLAISQSLGNAYPKHIVATIWKLMFYNAAHDSIGGCNSDDTNQDVFFRYKEAKGLAQNLLELHTRLITQRIPRQHDFTFTVFNPLPWSVAPGITFEAWLPGLPFTLRDGNGKAIPCVIESEEDLTQYVLNQTIRLDPGKAWHKPEKVCRTRLTVNSPVLPALGYDRWYIDFSEDNAARPALSQETTAENDVYHIQAEADGLLTITDKRSGKRYPRQMLFVENGDDGDSYNYSPPRADWMITSEGAMTTVQKQKSTVSQGLILRYALKVPADLAERAAGTATTTLNLKVKVVLQNDDLIRFNVEVDNNVLSHRLCVHFATDIAARVSCADQLFGAVTRPVQLGKALQCWEEERWQEKPISIEPMQSYVNLHDEQHGFTLHTNGVREYEIVGDDFNTLSLTLFRTFGFMGKENLLYRPGRASGESIVETPDAQLLKTMTFSFGWRTYLGTFDEAQHARVSKTWLTEFPVYQDSDFLNGRLRFCLNDEVRDYPETYSALSLPATHRDALVSAVKCAEDHSGIIIRFYNPHLETDVVIPPLQDARCVMLDEMTPMQARQTLKPNDVQTVLIKRI